MSNRGQFFSYDAIVSAAIFLITMALLLSYWWGIEGNMDAGERMEQDAARISGLLLSPGVPQDWQKRGMVRSVGLSEGSNIISPEKLGEFKRMSESDYEGLKSNLVTGNDYYVEIIGDGLGCGESCRIGLEPPEDSENGIATRLVVLNGKPARMRVTIWKR